MTELSTQIVPSSTTPAAPTSSGEDDGFWNRKTLTRIFFLLLALVASVLSVVFGGGIIAVVLSSPLWFPVLLLTMPCWVPVACCTSPAWGTGGFIAVLLGGAALFGTSFLGIVVLFLLWPDEWMPDLPVFKWLMGKRNEIVGVVGDIPKTVGLA
uniref:Uncharacterized protein n=1 Tax=Grammatophora oceanica TaxID=210454 RepID=A0A7S1VBR3_9STRA|mmetsp:Transcript_42257/g.62613  ORF Transcript_42257/g.62613 Transcript_42257/m.62613 type:complete len:154 (+) Transcript_42257:133-594(+)|eukprot:CAMPEP_0194043772 /NCGR_PEP_ID=MMETSP0009_2-20130614/15349_1 /TAXON_ID=210454 /ORGANISM="Grammatophora oceanica, Strain CCMP 410" /LENGTH=153 /DNA_ID=CAMNT_0038688099 /DNA_START=103 /DNA_END=564 /DNA_ORIENTATION=+